MPPAAVDLTGGNRRARINQRLTRISPGLGALYRDACRLMTQDPVLESNALLAAHCCREIESALRDVLRGLAGLEKPSGNNPGNHRLDVEAILADLEIELDHPVAVLWATMPEAAPLHSVAHRESLLDSRRTEEFEASWDRFEAILDFVLERHEARAARAFDLIDDLVTRPGAKSLGTLQGAIPQNVVSLGYFFQKADAGWIPVLRGTAYLRPNEIPDAQGRFDRWPAGPWAIQVAQSDLAFAKGLLDDLARTANPFAATVALSVVEQLETRAMAERAADIAHWVRVSRGYSDGTVSVRIIVKLSTPDTSEAALAISEAALELPA